jgi:D-alanine-D-alanine ligase
MMANAFNAARLLTLPDPVALRVLFMAPYAPDAPDYELNPYTGDGTYPQYHFEVFERLRRLGLRVQSTSKPYTIVHAGGAVDYVFSLFNRMPIRNSEIFVSAYCEYIGVPYLGAPPNVRAVAEDKFVSKAAARSLGIPAPLGVPYHRAVTPRDEPPFPGPYFIKDRFGAASELITAESRQEEWSGARRVIEWLWDEGTDALVEEFFEGLDVTVPVIGSAEGPLVLGVFEPVSDQPGRILTHDLKLTDHLGYEELPLGAAWVCDDVRRLWNALGPIDYFRVDYRYDPATRQRRFLEVNVCCYIGECGPFGLAAEREGVDMDALVEHMVAFSLLRQHRAGQHRQRIL